MRPAYPRSFRPHPISSQPSDAIPGCEPRIPLNSVFGRSTGFIRRGGLSSEVQRQTRTDALSREEYLYDSGWDRESTHCADSARKKQK